METFKVYNFVPQQNTLTSSIKSSWKIEYKRGLFFKMSRISNDKRTRINFYMNKTGTSFQRFSGNYSLKNPMESCTYEVVKSIPCNGYGNMLITDGPVSEKEVKFQDLVYYRFKKTYKITKIKSMLSPDKNTHVKFFKGKNYSKSIFLSKDAEFEIIDTKYNDVPYNYSENHVFEYDDKIVLKFTANGTTDVNIKYASYVIINSYTEDGLCSREVFIPEKESITKYMNDIGRLLGKEK